VQVVTNEGTKLKVRLYGIDAPETTKMNHRTGVVSKPGQPYGDEASRALENKVLGKKVKVQIMDIRPLSSHRGGSLPWRQRH
jgi:micrococcal nuclease